jgi:hypothetical protein
MEHIASLCHKRFLPCESSLMLAEVQLVVKGFYTLITLERLSLGEFCDVEWGSSCSRQFPHILYMASHLCEFSEAQWGLTSDRGLSHILFTHRVSSSKYSDASSGLTYGKTFPHWLHSLGFSPVWILWWTWCHDLWDVLWRGTTYGRVFLHSLH